MFSFYGSKQKIARYYPEPIYDDLTEAFCGSGKYALLHYEKNVTLVDVDPIVVAVWRYLQETTPEQIRSLPNVENATVLETVLGFSQLAQEEKWLIGFCCNGGSAQPKKVSGRHNFNSWNKDKERIANSLFKIKHWKIIQGSYNDIANSKRTWFIDPPYKGKGKWYKYNDIDYNDLAKWCKERLGQVIVCENLGADWLPFVHLRDIPFTHFKTEADLTRKTSEAIWHKENND